MISKVLEFYCLRLDFKFFLIICIMLSSYEFIGVHGLDLALILNFFKVNMMLAVAFILFP